MKQKIDQKEMKERVEVLIQHFRFSHSMFAKKVDIDNGNFHKKINGKQTWTIFDINKISDKLNVSKDWLLYGIGKMIKEETYNPTMNMLPSDFDTDKKESLNIDQSIANHIESLSKEELINLVKEIMQLHNEQTEMYRMLIRQNEQMIRYGQERFNNITNIIKKV